MTVRRYRIDGKTYLAESADSAYGQHMKFWRQVRLSSGYPAAVPVFVEHPDRPITAENVEDSDMLSPSGNHLLASCSDSGVFCDSLRSTDAAPCAQGTEEKIDV